MTQLAAFDIKPGDVIQVIINGKPVFTIGPDFDSRPHMPFDGSLQIGVEFRPLPKEAKDASG